jgi:predicted DNA-binding protein (MmcQ/YjbR family)
MLSHPMAHSRKYNDSHPAIRRLREVCLAFPAAFEKEAWGECTFRVTGGSMFAMTDNNHHNSGHIAVWVKAPPMVQEILVKSDPGRFFVPPYMGPKGWVGVRLDDQVNWDEVAGILNDGYLMSAPKNFGGRVPSTMDQAASMSDLATKRRSTSRTKMIPASKGNQQAKAKSRSRKTSRISHNEVR